MTTQDDELDQLLWSLTKARHTAVEVAQEANEFAGPADLVEPAHALLERYVAEAKAKIAALFAPTDYPVISVGLEDFELAVEAIGAIFDEADDLTSAKSRLDFAKSLSPAEWQHLANEMFDRLYDSGTFRMILEEEFDELRRQLEMERKK